MAPECPALELTEDEGTRVRLSLKFRHEEANCWKSEEEGRNALTGSLDIASMGVVGTDSDMVW